MIKFTFLLVVFAAANSYGQIVIPSLRNRLEFTYDVSGNQTKRELKRPTYVPGDFQPVDPIISVPQSRKVSATAEEKEASGLGQTLPLDVKWHSSLENSALKYFPNPVQDILYVQWEELERDVVIEIHLYTMKGLFLSKKSISGQDKSCSIDFQNYPIGTYNLLVTYENRKKQFIKIIKN